ncbi:unnamed protein product [Clonostachys rosea f. rosea IK726]|uniref:Uncharacterized protein n=2 Tax=Bionectria ochroleuca TaxID=29856 RepID=A0ACA9T909_BIOOC|nr:unnamed protein product [Clonostachys rosea f. rosea IK726]
MGQSMGLISWPATIGTAAKDIHASSICLGLFTKTIRINGPLAQWSAHYWLLHSHSEPLAAHTQ